MNATMVQDSISATKKPNAIPATADHQQLIEQLARRMVYIYYIVINSWKKFKQTSHK